MPRKTTVTLTPDPKIWKQFRIYCIERGVSATQLFEDFMRRTLENASREKEKAKK